ncbi:uncharacterized protein LOC109858349 isoform X2 [Pseudomyrmex gracilis]|uniref:uncharacterized protein LOC109858349 isoform X2 n=1 Tax=Pseudomyrmex gracilis TaxID=219809 RepID=UPI000995312E|nr:uncharacterized protein LOC109858349 isoform X2 [Pseudomyrmex gracilis]
MSVKRVHFEKVKLEETVLNEMYENSFLLNCSDEILLAIFKHLRPEDLMNLSLSCKKLERIVKDRTLWKKITIYLKTDMKFSRLFLLSRTKNLTINGNRCCHHVHDGTINYIHEILLSFTDLEELTLEDFYITPETCLILNNILWPISLDFIQFFGLIAPNLTELRINSCVCIDENLCMYHYMKIYSRSNVLKKLEILDLRKTSVNTTIFTWCCRTCKNLKQLYLECPRYLQLCLNEVHMFGWEIQPTKRYDVEIDRCLRDLIIRTASPCCPQWHNLKLIDKIISLHSRDNIKDYSLLYFDGINDCRNLEILAIRHYQYISTEFINCIPSLPKLKTLDFSGAVSILERDIKPKLRKDVKIVSLFDT